jgi:MFS family permease
VVAPIAGNLVDRFGPRLLLAGGLAAVGVGLVAAVLHADYKGWEAWEGGGGSAEEKVSAAAARR